MAVLAFVVVLSACGDKGGGDDTNTNTGTQPQECAHEWESQSSTATCTAAGKETFKCSLCQETKEEDAAALGHDMQASETIKPTCMEGGYDIFKCSRCDATENRNETDISYAPDAHDYQNVGLAATCTTAGYEDKICTRCGGSAGARKPLPALGHTYERDSFDGTTGVSRVEPTCTANGTITYACTEEGCTVSVTKTYEELSAENASDDDKALAETLKALGHNFQEAEDLSNRKEYQAPTCTTNGYAVYTCQNGCGEEERVVAGLEALTHTYERNVDTTTWAYAVETAPTCHQKGYEWVVCEDCDFNTKNEETPNPAKYGRDIDATGAHVYVTENNSNVKQTVAATCTTTGYTVYTCVGDPTCPKTEIRDQVGALGHDWVLTEEDLGDDGMPTCKTNGDYPYHCSRCPQTGINKDGETNTGVRHEGYTAGDFSHAQSVAPTCVSRGKYYCTDCQTTFDAYADDTEADATGAHTFDVKMDTIPSTCSEYGYTVYGCSKDAACTYTVNKDYTPYAEHSYKDATEDGTITCLDCAKSYRDVTTAVKTTTDILCTCGFKADDDPATVCLCTLSVEFIATKVPDPATGLTTENGFTFTKDDFIDDCGPALIVFIGEEGTTYTVTVYNDAGEPITTFDVIVGGVDTSYDLNVPTTATSGEDKFAYVDLSEIAQNIDKVTVTASAAATVQFYYPIA